MVSRPSASVLDHLHAPRNAGVLADPQAVGRADLDGRAPRIAIYLAIARDTVVRATFQTFGCGYSIACCSALTELVVGRSIAACKAIGASEVERSLIELPPEKQFCAQLAVLALRNGLNHWTEMQGAHDG